MNIVSAVKYESGVDGLKTEEQLLDIFAELRKFYDELRGRKIKILSPDIESVDTFQEFLEIATDSKRTRVLLKGIGVIAGLTVQDAIVEYDMSHVARLVSSWDSNHCGDLCENYRIEHVAQDITEPYCRKGHTHFSPKKCDDIDPKFKNEDGEPARSLYHIIQEASVS